MVGQGKLLLGSTHPQPEAFVTQRCVWFGPGTAGIVPWVAFGAVSQGPLQSWLWVKGGAVSVQVCKHARLCAAGAR